MRASALVTGQLWLRGSVLEVSAGLTLICLPAAPRLNPSVKTARILEQITESLP